MDLSIVIPVHDDVRIEKCVDSIDENVEVVVALNKPTIEVAGIVKRLGVKSINVPEQNLGMCYNAGMDASSSQLVLFMDSDCVFAPRTIERVYDAKMTHPDALIRGHVVYLADSLQSRITKAGRDVTTTNVPYAFIPLLLLDKNVFSRINDGHRFAEDVGWTADYEFELRRSKAGIPLVYVPEAKIFHDPVTIASDLRSAFKYGTGKRIRHERTGERVNFLEVLKEPILRGFREAGPMTGLYLVLWKSALYSGYYSQKYGLSTKG
ncbi:MAG TPA: glycosyltransferase [Candidatus Nanoarchaeia archaeon]|nr:glycosyltransferase [Candidatus Nanoarchaeia archaeon]